MQRLLLVARNPSLAFGLASASDDIIEVRPALVGRLEISRGMADVVVIEQEQPEDALTTLDLIRAGGLLAPAVLVASSRAEWASFDPGARPSVAVLDPPITQDRLGQSVGSANDLPDAPEPVDEPIPARGDAGDDSGAWWDEATPIAVAAAAAPPAVDEALPDGPEELEANGEPYGTATHEVPTAAVTEAPAVARAGADGGAAEAEETARAPSEDEATAQGAAEAATAAGTETESQSDTDSDNLAIPVEAHLPRPGEILSDDAPDTIPEVALDDEEAALTVADGSASPSAIVAEPTQAMVAWQGHASTEGRVYAEMASLVAASGELLADADLAEESPSAPSTSSGDDPLHVDLSKVFVNRDSDLAADTVPGPSADMHRADTEPGGSEITPAAQATPAGRAAGAVVDLREPLPEDPRSTPALVRALLSRTHEVYGVSEVGGLVVGDALARTGASAGALLLQDGDSWRVAAGEGLRRLEHRYVLSSDSWLVTTIASRHKGVIIERTDIARRPLAGAPLAAHKHLVAAPVRAVAGILLIARDDDPGFGERDLASLARLAEASSGILASAMDARQLARLLGDIRDQDDRAATDRIDYGV